MARALVVQPDPSDGPGWLDSWLPDAGLKLDVVRPYAGEAVPPSVEADALVVLGGVMGADDDARHPWLADVRSLLASAVADDTPTLAICLGAQLLARAAGGEVARNAPAGPEVGLGEVRLRPGAAGDPLFGGLPPRLPCVQWHYDAVSALPPGAHLLADSAVHPYQAYRLGERVWGLQWHPEVTTPMAASWARSDDAGVRRQGLDPVALIGQIAAHETELVGTWRPVAERFALLAAG